MKTPYISIVIPTFNEEGNISYAISGIRKVLKDYDYEVIVVDKHSKDRTVEKAKRMGARILYDDIGKGSALVKGLKASRGSIQISMDADLSHEPMELKLLIAGIETGYDICMGSRFIIGGGSKDMPLIRKFGNKVFVTLVDLLFHTNYTDLCYGYRSFRKGVVNGLDLDQPGMGIETEISIKAIRHHFKVLEVPSIEKKRHSGTGKLRTFRDGYIILKTIFRNALYS